MAVKLSERKQKRIDREFCDSTKLGYLQKAKHIFQKGANFKQCHYVNYFQVQKELHTVAYINDHNTIVQLLENTGATPDYNEIMFEAALNGRVDKVEEAINQNANINAKQTDDLNTALHYASFCGYTETVDLLLKSNADPNIYNKWGHSPLYLAYLRGKHEIINLLCSFGAKDMEQLRNEDLLLTSAENGDIENVTLALTSGANVNVHYLNKDQKTPLHLTSEKGHCDIVQILLNYNADQNFCDKSQQTALHLASKRGHYDIVQLLLNSNADPNICDKWGHIPLHIAYWYGHHNIVKILHSFGAKDMDQVRNDNLLLTSAENGDIENVTQALTLGANVNVHHPKKNQQTALHLALEGGHCDIVKLLLNLNADPNICDMNQKTALHIALKGGHCDIIQLLLNSKANPNICDLFQKTALHLASDGGHYDVIQLLLNFNADPNICDKLFGQTPAHYAAQKGHFEILKLLHEVGQADINALDKNDNNLLHLACRSGNKETIHYLLHNNQLNPDHRVALNNDQQMPLDCIPPSNSNRFELLKLFQPFKKCQGDYLTESYAKIFLCGKTEAGKSSLAAIISYRADKWSFHEYNPEKFVEDVILQTTGIEYHSVHSNEIGNVVIFDFAGHAEYYSSHAAVLEALLLRSPAVFAILSNLTDDEETIKKELLFWFNFVENVSTKLSNPSQVLVLGSHIDELSSEKDFQPFVNDVTSMAVRFQNYKGFLPLDCHRPGGKGVKECMRKLKESCEAVVDRYDKMSYHCHCLNSYLQQLDDVAISLDELCPQLMKLNEPCLLTDRSIVLEFLTILGSKGLILFLANAWVIIDQKALLTDVNGVLFNKTIDRERKPVASNTGIMPVSTLANLFPKHNTDMLIRFLTSLQFCHEMDSYTVSCITNNVACDDFPIGKDEMFLFFPALITEDKPTSIFETTDGFGWCLWCDVPQQFLSMRFLHTLLHRFAYTYCPSPPEKGGYVVHTQENQELHRVCTMWKSGIYWREEENNIEVMVEVTEANRCVTVLVSHSNLIESYQLRASLIKEILNLKKELCPCTSKQFVIAPGNIKDIMDKEQKDRVVYALKEVAKGVLVKGTATSTNNERVNVQLVVGEKEPYLYIAPLVIKTLFTDSNKDPPLPDHYVQHIQEVCGEIMFFYPYSDFTQLSVREHLNKFSIFAGRNPLSIPSPPMKDEVIQRLSKHVQTRTTKEFTNIVTKPDKQMSSSITYNIGDEKPKRYEVLTQLAFINSRWRNIGQGLGVSFNDLHGMAQRSDSDQTRLEYVIQKWFDMNGQGEGAPVTWNTILNVINGPLVQDITRAMRIYEYLKAKSSAQQDTQSSNSEVIGKISSRSHDNNGVMAHEETDNVNESISDPITENNNTVSECAKESCTTNSCEVFITDNLSMEHQQHSTNELSSEHKAETLPNDTTQQGTCDPSKIFQENFADICDAIEVKPLPIVNWLFSANLISLSFKKDVQSMSGDPYNIANKVVDELQRQVDEKGIEFLKAICDFLLKYNQVFKDIGVKIKDQLEKDVTHTDKNIIEQQSDGKLINKRSRSFSHSTSKKLKQSDNTDNDQLDVESACVTITTEESDLESTNWVESNDSAQSMEFQENDSCLSSDYKQISPSLHESSTTHLQKETNPVSCKRKVVSNFNSDDLPETKKFAQEQQESNIRGVITHRDKNTICKQTDDIDEIVGKSITEDNNTVSGKFNASKILRVHSADLCDIIVDANPHRIVNRLACADLLPTSAKEEVKSIPDKYDKADKIVEKLQGQIDDDEHPNELLKKICDFLLEQTDKTLKDIGTKMMSQL